jgi:type I restriction enzyme S subunit
MEKLLPQLRFPKFNGEWEEKKLGDAGEVKMCKRIFNDDTSPEGDIPFYKIGSFGKIADAFITQEKYLDFRKKYSFPSKGDILISAAGTIGRTVVYNGEDAYYQDSNIVWISNDYSTVSNEFLFYIYQIVKYNTEGGTIQRLYNNILKSTKFNSPSLPEQTKIATFLTAVDEKLTALKQKKTLLEQYKKGVMQQIFSQELRFKEDTSTSLSTGSGNDFADWEEKKLGEICEIAKSGGTPTSTNKEYYNGDIPFLSISDMTSQGKYLYFTSNHISALGLKNSSSWLVPTDSIIYSMYASVGFVAINKVPLATSQAVLNLIFKSEVNLEFMYYTLIDFQKNIAQFITTGTQGNLNAHSVKGFLIQIPSLPEQTKIANFLTAIDEKINHCQAQIEKATIWKKGLLQQLFV